MCQIGEKNCYWKFEEGDTYCIRQLPSVTQKIGNVPNGLMYKEVLNRILTVPVGVLLAAYIKEQTEIN